MEAFGGQVLSIATNTNTYINPFDSSLEYEESEEALNNKIEFVLAFIESIVSKRRSDRRTKNHN